MPVLTKYQNVPEAYRSRILNHAWLAKGIGEDEFYFIEIDAATGSFPVSITPTTRSKAWNSYLDYSGTPVTTAAYVTVNASTAAQSTILYIFDSSGQGLYLATGGAGSEVDQVFIPPGGWGAGIEITVAAGTRVSVKAVTATANAGFLMITALT